MFNKYLVGVLCLLISTLSVATTSEKVVDIQNWQTTAGTQVYFTPSTNLPMVDISLIFAAGSARDGEQSGLANLTNNLIGENTQGLRGDAIAEQFDKVGAQFNTAVDKDKASINLRSLVAENYLNPALDTLHKVITQATFPESTLKRVRNQQLRALEQSQQAPEMLAENAFFQELFKGTPYAHPVLGESNSVRQLTVQQVHDFYKRYYVANNAVLIIVGDLSKKQARQIAEQLTQGWASGKKAAPLPPIKQRSAAFSQHITYPAAQTHILIGQVGINMQNPDYFSLYVGNYILGGGGLVSLLFNKIREQQGLSYSIHSAWQPLAANGPFLISLQTRTAQAQQAISSTQQVINDFIKQGPTAEQLKAAQQNLIGGFALGLDSNRDIVNNLSLIAFYGLPLNYLDTVRANIQALTPRTIQEAFQKHVNPQTLSTITVGKTDEQ